VATGAVGDAALVDPSEALAPALASETAGPAAAEHPDSTASTPKSSAIIVDLMIMSALGAVGLVHQRSRFRPLIINLQFDRA